MSSLRSSFTENQIDRKIIWAYFISLLIHLVILLVVKWPLARTIEKEKWHEVSVKLVDPEPMFRLQRPPQLERRPKNIVENPLARPMEKNPNMAQFLSDRNAEAAGNVKGKNPNQNLPYQPAGTMLPPIRAVEPSEVKESPSKKNTYLKESEFKSGNSIVKARSGSFSRESIGKSLGVPDEVQEYVSVNRADFSSNKLGDISLSTYKWEWAPYIFKMKQKLYRVWTAPPAYTQMGIIYGQTVLHLKIQRDGTMKELEVLKHEGHVSLQISSENAMHALFPFDRLPDNFPDRELELTITLVYPDLRRIGF